MLRNKNRILIVTPDYLPTVGGISEQCSLLVKQFDKVDINTDVLCELTPGLGRSQVINNNKVYRLNYYREIKVFGYIFALLNLGYFLMKSRNKYDLIIIRQLNFNCLALGLFKLIKVVKCSTFVTADSGGNENEISTMYSSKFKAVYKFLIDQHDYINSICSDNYKQYLKFGFLEKKLTKIGNGVVVSDYNESITPKSINTFLFIGRLVREKGLVELLKAFKGVVKVHRNAKLIIAGNGPLLGFINSFIISNNLSGNISYVGSISGKQKDDFFRKVDCLVLPSYSEGSPVALMEAAINKKLIIFTDVSDAKELYRDNLLICRKKDSEDLKEKMLYAMDVYPISKLNYDNIIPLIDIKKTCDEILDLA